MSTFLRVLNALKHSLVNTEGVSLANKFMRGLKIYEKIFNESSIEPRMTKKATDFFDVYRGR